MSHFRPPVGVRHEHVRHDGISCGSRRAAEHTADRVGADLAGPAVGMRIGAASLGAVICPAVIGLLVGRHGTDVIAPSFVVLTLLLPLAHTATVKPSRIDKRQL